jgi:protein-S-isoprenylcysteine O-methyltransferase Ste14
MQPAEKTVWRVRVGLAGLVVLLGVGLLALVASHVPMPGGMGLPFEAWYGNWRGVLVVTGLFTAFLLAFARPRRRVEWRNTGLYVAFLVSLFTEMFGLPLTIFLISPYFGVSPFEFGNQESHLWAYLLDRLDILPLEFGVYLVMVISVALIASAISLIAVGWVTVYRGRDALVTTGLYRYLRHPQYLGLILIVLAFNIQWPTLPTLLMAPILIVMYVRLARREDEELAARFDWAFIHYATWTRAFVPWGPGRPSSDTMKRVRQALRWALVGLVLALVLRTAVGILRSAPGWRNVPFDRWYWDWIEVATATAIFLAFVLGFARPRRPGEWRSAGVYSAFLVSLFTEMFGIPLTVYVLAPMLGLPVRAFGMNESHLWAFALDRLGLLPLRQGVYLVMAVSAVLIVVGMVLVAVGWASVYRGRHELVTGGIYRFLRHPQYLGLILVVVGFNVMWPTLPTLVMAPILVVMYVRLARREDDELATRFGDVFRDYGARTPAFLPWGGKSGPTEAPRAATGSNEDILALQALGREEKR